jgi:3-deoxy-D-manno-octulosonic-acid transferase
MYFLYSLVTVVGTILLTPYVLLSKVRREKYLPNLRERLGLTFPAELAVDGRSPSRTIWLHAVSVGEVLAAVPLARCLRQRFPRWRLVVSTTTATGQKLARERMNFSDAVFYFPFDWNGPVRRAFRAVQPDAIVILETEIWPNLLRYARSAGVPVVVVNGRLSDRSFRGFSRAVKISAGLLGGFLWQILNDAALYLVQSRQDAARLVALGAASDRVIVTGSMKYDLAEPQPNAFVNWLHGELVQSRRGPVVVAGSIIAGEEILVLEAFASIQHKWPQALLVLAPRKPDRFAAACEIAARAGWNAVRRSEISLDELSAEILGAARGEKTILVLDSLGELAALYGIADAVFIGGSLVPAGGHNPLEPAVFAKVPIFGRSMDNFHEIAAGLLEAGAAIQVDSAAQLSAAWFGLLEDTARRTHMGLAAREIVKRNRGATAATLDRVAAILEARRAHT